MESTPVSRASFESRCGGIRLQSCPSTLSLEAVGHASGAHHERRKPIAPQ